MILANGCPKSGTHALMQWFLLMGLSRQPGLLDCLHLKQQCLIRATSADPRPIKMERARMLPGNYFLHAHAHARAPVEWARVVTMMRDPRNVLVSYVRHKGDWPDSPESLIQAMKNFRGYPFQEVYRGFVGWRRKGLVIRYEDMPPGFAPANPRLYEGSAQDNDTWTGQPSDWREWWTERVDRVWRGIGGPELLAEAGYT